jgi:hypothetical protein
MKKRILAGVVTGSLVFGAVSGMAASMDVTAGKLGSGSGTVTSCDTNGVTSDYTFTSGTSTVSAVVVNGIADAACDGATVLVQALSSGGTVLTGGYGSATNTADGDTSDNSVSVSLNTGQPAADIASVRVTLKS